MSILNNHVDKNLAESFLHFLEDDNYSNNSQTYCQEKSNTYHDTSYIWCKVCDKIYCTRCSLNHLIKNQIDHTPSDKAFLRKEHLDVEFHRDCKKINEIQKYIDEFFSKNKNNMSQNEYKSLCEIYAKFSEFVKDLSNFLEKDGGITLSDTGFEEVSIQELAKKSIAADDSLESETLAIVLEKQGKYARALAMYEKLMHNNPEKSSTFAVRIAEIKARINEIKK